jgi:hypothetical protein
VLRAGPKEDPLDFRGRDGGKQDVAEQKRQQEPGQEKHGHAAPHKQTAHARKDAKPSQEAAKTKDKLQAGQKLDKNSTAKGTDASMQTNSAGARQANDAKAQIQQLKQNIKQDQHPQQTVSPSPERAAAGAAVGNPAFATGGAVLGVDMGMIAAGGALYDLWKFTNSLGQDISSSFDETNTPAPRSPLADMPGVDTSEDDTDAGAELKALEAQEAELAGIEREYTENTQHHEWREEHGVDYHAIEAPAGEDVQELNKVEEKPDAFDIDYVGMNLRDVQLKYNYDKQPQEAASQLHTATREHGADAMKVRNSISDEYELPPPELAKIGKYADQVMSFG